MQTDPDFVYLKRYGYSISKAIDAFPDGCSDRVIAQALGLQEEQIPELYQEIVVKLRNSLKIEE